MATNDYFDHADSLGRDTFARIRSFGYRDATMGENLAAGMPAATATFNQWTQRRPAPRRHAAREAQGHRDRPRLQRRLDARLVLDDDVRRDDDRAAVAC